MSATRMLVLGVVFWAGKAHGYQLRAELLSWRADSWARVKPGSLYHALRKAVDDGMMVDSVEPGDGGPERTVYAVTPAGRVELERLVRAGLSVPGDPTMLNAAVAMLPVLRREVAVEMLRQRVARLRIQLAELESWRSGGAGVKPEHVNEQAGLWIGQTVADLEWAEGLIERIDGGAYTFAVGDEPPAIQI
ncbi:PadR family transcriptional regulator [Actinokineospora auranticolor]|uniref:DNA-binding PadR family transcriptional regulator n=1 Tax=Actinokineospora auranticolor TaxID=155976 RepID=A0A2S6GYM3_9PSEU|nr:PadR family transcriptional regulator [Actinokineospora auranticolor]PPK70352.1 DNA-binding PadR family transcriptional regulator [Actinokineospora auranticolor]